MLKVPSGRRVAAYALSAGSWLAGAGQAATAPRVFSTASFIEWLGLAVEPAVSVANRAMDANENNMVARETVKK
jgi:hypothetical protein